MRWIYTLAGIVIVLYLLGRIRVGVEAGYACRDLTFKLRLGWLRIRILPGSSKKQHEKKRTRTTHKQKKSMTCYLPFLPCVLKALKRVLSGLRVDRLRANVKVATSDPADTVELYGRLNAAIGSLWGPIHHAVQIKDAKVHLDIDWQSTSSTAEAFLSVSWSISQLLSALFLFVRDVIIVAYKEREKNNQESMVAQYG